MVLRKPGLRELTELNVSITWETTSDWDSAQSEYGFNHSSGTLNPTVGLDSFEDVTSIPSEWNPNGTTSISTSRGWDGSNSLKIGDGSSPGEISSTKPNGDAFETVELVYQEESSQTSVGWELVNEGDTPIIRFGTDNPEVKYEDSSGEQTLIDTFSTSYGEWRKFTITLDYSNDQFDILWEDLTGSESDQQNTGRGMLNSSSGISEIRNTTSHSWQTSGSPNEATWMDMMFGVQRLSELVTAQKSFDSSVKPNLSGLSYSLNGGEIILDITGVENNETVTQTLDGSSSYSLSWSTSNQTFEVKITMKNGRSDSTPSTLSSLSLEKP